MKREPIDPEPTTDKGDPDDDMNESVSDNVDIVTDSHLVQTDAGT